MGMFDYLKTEYPLPEYPELQDLRFQTKDLQQYPNMDTFLITKGGILIMQKQSNPEYPSATKIGEIHLFSGYCLFYANITMTTQEYIKGRPKYTTGWAEFHSEFDKGVIQDLKPVIFEPCKLHTYPEIVAKENCPE